MHKYTNFNRTIVSFLWTSEEILTGRQCRCFNTQKAYDIRAVSVAEISLLQVLLPRCELANRTAPVFRTARRTSITLASYWISVHRVTPHFYMNVNLLECQLLLVHRLKFLIRTFLIYRANSTWTYYKIEHTIYITCKNPQKYMFFFADKQKLINFHAMHTVNKW